MGVWTEDVTEAGIRTLRAVLLREVMAERCDKNPPGFSHEAAA